MKVLLPFLTFVFFDKNKKRKFRNIDATIEYDVYSGGSYFRNWIYSERNLENKEFIDCFCTEQDGLQDKILFVESTFELN